MKQVLTLAFAIISFMSFSQTDSSKIKDIKHLIVISGSADNAKMGVEAMITSMKSQPNQNGLPEGFWDEFLKEIDYNELVSIFIPVYEKNYTHPEIIELIKFYESPTGKKMVEKTPSIMTESMILGREWGQKLGAKVYEKMKKN